MKFGFKKAETAEEYIKIYESREEICKEEFPYLLDHSRKYPMEDEFDSYSFLYYVHLNEKIVASCRMTPFMNNKWEITRNMPGDIDLSLNAAKTLQMNRVYIGSEYRNIDLHAAMFYNLAVWLLHNTQYTEYFATCNAGLVRLYKKIGAYLWYPDPFKLNGRGGHNYYLVRGNINDFYHFNNPKFSNYAEQ